MNESPNPESPYLPPTAPPPTDPLPAGGWDRVIGVLYAPTKTFAAIAERPSWLPALVVLIVLGTAVSVLMSSKVDFERAARDAMSQSGQKLNEEQMEKAIEIQKKVIPVMMYVAPIVFGPVLYALLGLVFWGGLTMLGGETDFRKAFAATVHGFMPHGVASVLAIPVVLTAESLSMEDLQRGGGLASNLAAFAPEDTSKPLLALLGSVDVFTIWTIVLLAIGLAAVGKVSRAKAAVLVGGLFVVYLLGKVGIAFLTPGSAA